MTRTLFAISLLTAAYGFAQDSRDLSRYDTIGPFLVGHVPSTSRGDESRIKGQVREFLWTHWRRNRRATVTVVTQYVEGRIRRIFFVEPDIKGKWAIVEQLDQPAFPAKEPSIFSCPAIERVESGTQPLVPIPNAKTREPETYLLHPVCSQGKDAKLW